MSDNYCVASDIKGEDEHGEYVIRASSKGDRRQGVNGVEIGDAGNFTMTVDFGDTRGLKFLVCTDKIPSEEQRNNLKEQLGIVIRTREEDEAINGKHEKI